MCETPFRYFRTGDRVRLIPGTESAVDPEVAILSRRKVAFRVTDVRDVSNGPCDCRRPRPRNHRRWCASLALDRNGGHPQQVEITIDGRRHWISAAILHRA